MNTRFREKMSRRWQNTDGVSVIRVDVIDAGELRTTYLIERGGRAFLFTPAAFDELRTMLQVAREAP